MDKQVTLVKSKGNQRQFEHNAQIDSIFDRLTSANVPEKKHVTNLIVEGNEIGPKVPASGIARGRVLTTTTESRTINGTPKPK